MKKTTTVFTGIMEKYIKSGASKELITRQVEVQTPNESSAISILAKAHKGWNFQRTSSGKPKLTKTEVEV